MSTQRHQIRDLRICSSEQARTTYQLLGQLSVQLHSLLAWTWQRGMSIPAVQARDHLIIHLEQGALTAELDGRRYQAKTGDLIWIPKGTLRSLRAEKRSLFIASHLDLIQDAGMQLQVPIISKFHKADFQYVHTLLEQQVETNHTHLRLAADFFLQWIRHQVFNQVIKLEIQDKQDQLIKKVLADLEQNPALSAEQCARLCGLGITRFRQRFRKACGLSPGKYITRLRIRIASKLLRETQMPIAEIALACGYENPNYLYRAFKRIHLCTPHAYRSGQISTETFSI